MTEDVITVDEHKHVNDLIKLFIDNGISSAPVVAENGDLVGIVTKTDILGHFLDLDLEISVKIALQDILEHVLDHSGAEVTTDTELTVGKIMTNEPLTADIKTPIKELSKRMIKHNIHRMIITENDCVCGLISTLDILYHVAGIEKHERD